MLKRKLVFLISLAATGLAVFVPATFSAEHIKKEYRNSFLSSSLQEKFYKIQVQTCRFLDRQYSTVTGLVESFRGTSRYAYDMFTRSFCYGRNGALDCQSFTYDGSLAVLSYALAGNKGKAAKILSAYRKEFYRPKGDAIGLFNSYRTDITDRTGLCIGIDGDRIHLGPNMWVGIAALQYTALTGDLQFLSLVVDLAKWAQHLNHFTFPDGEKGGVSMGYGWGPDWSLVYSTENNVDYYAVLSMLKKMYSQRNERIKNIFDRKGYGIEDIDKELKGLERWLKEIAYEPKEKRFYCGYNEKGCDTKRALDTITWTIAALGPERLKEMGINPFALADYAERKFSAANTINGETIKGFDFTDALERQRKIRLVWIEGTGQQIVAYQLLSEYANKVGFTDRAEEYRLKAIKYSDELEKVATAASLIDRALPYTARRLAEKDIVFTFDYEWEVPRGNNGQWVGSVAATTWRYFALSGFNPLNFEVRTVSYPLFSVSKKDRSSR